jgi:hypothetical protein
MHKNLDRKVHFAAPHSPFQKLLGGSVCELRPIRNSCANGFLVHYVRDFVCFFIGLLLILGVDAKQCR